MAAFTIKPASVPRRNGIPFITKDSTPERATRHFTTRKPDGRDRGGHHASTDDDEQQELPKPDDNQDVIIKALRKRKVCFYHVRGVSCPHQEGTTICRSSHDDQNVPYGQYKLPERQSDTVFAITDVERVQLEMTHAYSGQQETEA